MSDYYVAEDELPEPEWANEEFGKMSNAVLIDKVAKSKSGRMNNDQSDDAATAVEAMKIVKPVAFRLTPTQIQYLVYDVIRPAIRQFVQKKQKTNQELTNRFNSDAVERIRSFNGFDKDGQKNRFGTHSLRKIYANYSFDNYAIGMSRNAWITKVLGHEPTSVTTSLSYTTTSISQMPKFVNQDDMRSSIAFLMSKIEKLESANKKRKFENMDDDLTVTFVSSDNDEVTVEQASAGGDRLQKCIDKIRELVELKITPSFANLRKLGFGTYIISDAKKVIRENDEST